MKQRIEWVDAAKGFAMLCIIIGHFCAFFMNHIDFARYGFLIIGSFHVPMFFLMSGYTMSTTKWMGWTGIKKLAKRCFLPYIFAGILSILMCMFFVDPNRLYDYVFGFFYGAGAYRDNILFGDTSHVNAIGLIWFLPALFFGKIITSAMSKINLNIRLLITAGLFFGAVYTAPILFLPMGIQEGMCAAWFMTVGLWLKERNAISLEATKFDKGIIVALFMFGLFYLVNCVTLTIWSPMYCNSTYNAPVMDLFGTVGTCIVMIMLVKFLTERIYCIKRLFVWCGLYSMGIFVFHAITLAPGDNVKWWCYKLMETGNDGGMLFFLLLAINLVLVFGATLISKHIKPLVYILYGSKAPVMPDKELKD